MRLTDSITNILPPRYRSHGGEFIRFGIVGSLGFVVDTATVYSLRGWLGLYVSATISFLVAASFNWLLNRLWSFRGRAHDAAHIQWLRFLLANLVGFILNRGTFFILIAASPFIYANPVIAVAAGSLAGLGVNFILSKRFVFR